MPYFNTKPTSSRLVAASKTLYLPDRLGKTIDSSLSLRKGLPVIVVSLNRLPVIEVLEFSLFV